MIFDVIKSSIQLDYKLINQFNENLIAEKKIQVISRTKFEILIDYILQRLEKIYPEGVNRLLEVSIQISREVLDYYNFYSLDNLSEKFLEELNKPKNLNFLGKGCLRAVE